MPAGTENSPGAKRLAIVGASARAMLHGRAGLIRAAVARGHRVMVVAPAFSPAEQTALTALGVERVAPTPSPAPSRLWWRPRERAALSALLASWSPHTVLGFGDAPAIEAALAAKEAGVAHIVFQANEWPVADVAEKRELARALAASHAIVCHNADQVHTLRAFAGVDPSRPIAILPGGGVDLAHFATAPLPGADRPLTFLMLSRLERARGVLDYCAAARLFRLRHPEARFVLAGPAGAGGGAVSGDELMGYAADVEYAGEVGDVRPLLAACHVYVYPSHGEGMPASVLEALAVGRPVIAARVPGSRETVDEGVNGALVDSSDVPALVAAMTAYVKWPELIAAGARASRAKAERLFDSRVVLQRWLAVLGL